MKKFCFSNSTDSIPEPLQKGNLNENVFQQILSEFFRTAFPLTLSGCLCMESTYSGEIYLQNTSKTLPKICE